MWHASVLLIFCKRRSPYCRSGGIDCITLIGRRLIHSEWQAWDDKNPSGRSTYSFRSRTNRNAGRRAPRSARQLERRKYSSSRSCGGNLGSCTPNVLSFIVLIVQLIRLLNVFEGFKFAFHFFACIAGVCLMAYKFITILFPDFTWRFHRPTLVILRLRLP